MADEKPIRIWACEMMFKKNGFPSVGAFGASCRDVIVLRAEDWTRLCAEIPELATRQFEVGTEQ